MTDEAWIQQTLAAAVEHHRARRYAQAEELYQQILASRDTTTILALPCLILAKLNQPCNHSIPRSDSIRSWSKPTSISAGLFWQ
jgi:hypothetical protein